jgi:hypothetical protein
MRHSPPVSCRPGRHELAVPVRTRNLPALPMAWLAGEGAVECNGP